MAFITQGTELPNDINSKPIQALYPARANNVTVTGTTARSSAVGGMVKVVELTPTVDMFIKMGDSTVNATTSDIFIAAGVVYDFHMKGNTHIAAIRSSTSGTLYITELE